MTEVLSKGASRSNSSSEYSAVWNVTSQGDVVANLELTQADGAADPATFKLGILKLALSSIAEPARSCRQRVCWTILAFSPVLAKASNILKRHGIC